jgi:hypothetical protein
MTTRGFAVCAGLLVTAAYLSGMPASALTMKECSEKYKAAKAAGNTAKWNDFRKAECGSDTSATPAAAPPAPPAAAPAATPAPEPSAAEVKPEKKAKKKAAKTETDKYKTQTPHFQRLHTCSDQWQANKANNGNGGLKWPQFYHECNTRLKGA